CTEAACTGSAGPVGGVDVLQAWEGERLVSERELSGAEAQTTNNRMELMAAIAALEALERAAEITVVTDSVYLRDGISKWIHGWKRNGWKTADKKPVKNAELWQRLDAAQARHRVRWEWIRGHAGHEQNERADGLARAAIREIREGRRRPSPDAAAR